MRSETDRVTLRSTRLTQGYCGRLQPDAPPNTMNTAAHTVYTTVLLCLTTAALFKSSKAQISHTPTALHLLQQPESAKTQHSTAMLFVLLKAVRHRKRAGMTVP